MSASCIGAAGMTSGFGPSYQEFSLALPKVNSSVEYYCVMHQSPKIISVYNAQLRFPGFQCFGWQAEERKWISAGQIRYGACQVKACGVCF